MTNNMSVVLLLAIIPEVFFSGAFNSKEVMLTCKTTLFQLKSLVFKGKASKTQK